MSFINVFPSKHDVVTNIFPLLRMSLKKNKSVLTDNLLHVKNMDWNAANSSQFFQG